MTSTTLSSVQAAAVASFGRSASPLRRLESIMATGFYRDLFTEKPYAATLETEHLSTRCSTCFAEGATIPCSDDGCDGVFYCNDQCRAEDQSNHKYECAAFKETAETMDSFVRLLARILTRRLVDGGIAHLSENFPENIRDRSLGDLMSHQAEIEKCPDRSKEMTTCLEQFAKAFVNTPLVNDWKLVKRMYCVMYINCFSVSGQLSLINGSGPTLGCAFYLNISRFNHSCRPNLYVFFHGSRLSILYMSKATDEAEAAEERLAMTRSAKKFNRMTISYGFWDYFSDSYFPLRRHRHESLKFGYYFKCKCVLCSDKREAALEEHAAPIECKKCGEPYVWKEISRRSPRKCWMPIKSGLDCRKSCSCGSDANESDIVKAYVENIRAGKNLKDLESEWENAMSFRMDDNYADHIIVYCEPVWKKAQSFWHRTANLRMNHLQERLFISCYAVVIRNRKAEKPVDLHALNMALQTGEASLAWYKRHNDNNDDTTMAAYATELAKLYEISASLAETKEQAVQDFKTASSHYAFAASMWKRYGQHCSRFVQHLTVQANKAERSAADCKLELPESETTEV